MTSHYPANLVTSRDLVWILWAILNFTDQLFSAFFTNGRNEIFKFQGFSSIYQRVCDILFTKSFLIARSYRVLAIDIKVLSISVLVGLRSRLKSQFWRFLAIFDILQSAHYGTSLYPKTVTFTMYFYM